MNLQKLIIKDPANQIEFWHLENTGKTKLIYLPGANNTPATNIQLLKSLAKDFDVYSPFYPGFGRSGEPRSGHTIINYLEQLVLFLAKVLEPQEQFIFMGHSFGAHMIGHYLLAFPQVQSQLKLVVWAAPMIKLRSNSLLGMIPRYALHEWQSLTIKKKSRYLPFTVDPRNLHSPLAQLKHTQMILREPLEPELFKDVSTKILTIIGLKDYVIDSQYTVGILEKMKNNDIHTYPELGHDAFAQIGEDLNGLIKANSSKA